MLGESVRILCPANYIKKPTNNPGTEGTSWVDGEMVAASGLPHKHAGCSPTSWWLLLIALFIFPSLVIAQQAGEVVSVLGEVQVLREGRWQAVSAGAVLDAGESIRTGEDSRVAIQLANGSQLKLNANSRLELKQIRSPQVRTSNGILRNVMRVLSGEVWIRSDGAPLEVETIPATASIRGTEFNLAITGKDTARLAVLDGLVEFANPQGSVLVAANEQATAKVGEAPRKTVLINPLDAVQWSLYYPGMTSYRDYPLSGFAAAQLPQQLAAATARSQSSPQDASAWIALGEINFDLGFSAEAREAFVQALRLAPTNGKAQTGLGWVYLDANEPESALLEFDKVRSSTLMSLVGKANALYRLERWEDAAQVINEAKNRFPASPLPWQQAALNNLVRGRPDAAIQDLDQALALDSSNALTHSLRSNILLVQNRKESALEAAQQAIAANALSPSAQLSLSLVRQAEFELDEALHAAQQAVELDPNNPQALIQESRLLFGMGQVTEAFAIAERARQLAPNDSQVNSTWGFLQLARGQESQAIQAFEDALRQDTTRGEPHLGLGLVLFRQNKTEQAVEQIRKATLLEPRVSLYQSYLGKAFYEVKQDALASKHLAIAKQLDPRDPTPYFYNAIRLQSVNRPIEAVQELQESIALNDNRAVYRSRLLLDEDEAARGATLGRIYSEVGFEQRALVEGFKSVASDPRNHSAHRFIADSYLETPRHEIARASELLQAQLLQPFNINPIQPQLAVSDLSILKGIEPSTSSVGEYNPLFYQDGFTFRASGVAGSNSTIGDDASIAGVKGPLSFSLAQFHYETDGFRENNDLTQDIYNVFLQARISENTTGQVEYRRQELERGDLALRFDETDFSANFRESIEADLGRVGLRHDFSPFSTLLGSLIYQSADFEQDDSGTSGDDQRITRQRKGFLAETQHIFQKPDWNVITGISYIDQHVDQDTEITTTIPREVLPGIIVPVPLTINFSDHPDTLYYSLYSYGQYSLLPSLDITLGFNADHIDIENKFNRTAVNPKFGLLWQPSGNTLVRMAALRTTSRTLTFNQTIEPVEVSGFNQFFDDPDGSRVWRYGVGLDQKISQHLFGGIEISARDLEIAAPSLLSSGASFFKWNEKLAKAYLNWTPNSYFSINAEYRYEYFDRDSNFNAGISELDTHWIPIGVNFSHPSGWSTVFEATYINQSGRFSKETGTNSEEFSGRDQFWTADAMLRYRLPKRYGLLTAGVKNIFDEEFNYQEIDFNRPQLIPERFIFANINLKF